MTRDERNERNKRNQRARETRAIRATAKEMRRWLELLYDHHGCRPTVGLGFGRFVEQFRDMDARELSEPMVMMAMHQRLMAIQIKNDWSDLRAFLNGLCTYRLWR